MLTLSLTIFSGFASLIVAAFFIYKWKKQEPKSISTLFWGLGFLASSATHFLSVILDSETYQISAETLTNLVTLRGVFTDLFLVLIFYATVRLVTHRKVLIIVICVIGFSVMSLVTIGRDFLFDDTLSYITFKSYFVLIPVSTILTAIFLILYGVLMAEAVKRKRGVLIIVFAWLLYGVRSLILPSLFPDNLNIWYIGHTIFTFILLTGFIVLDYESRKAFEHLQEDKNNHHHFK